MHTTLTRFKEVIDDLLVSDGITEGRPVVAPKHRKECEALVRRILVDQKVLSDYLRLLQEQYQARMRQPDLRLRCWFHEEPLPIDKETAVITRGLRVLSNEDLGSLALNPIALPDLSEQLGNVDYDELASDWLEALDEYGADIDGATVEENASLFFEHWTDSTSDPESQLAYTRDAEGMAPEGAEPRSVAQWRIVVDGSRLDWEPKDALVLVGGADSRLTIQATYQPESGLLVVLNGVVAPGLPLRIAARLTDAAGMAIGARNTTCEDCSVRIPLSRCPQQHDRLELELKGKFQSHAPTDVRCRVRVVFPASRDS